MSKIKVNSLVRLRGKKRTARVEVMLTDIPGGVRLGRKLGGFHYWNVENLEVVPRTSRIRGK